MTILQIERAFECYSRGNGLFSKAPAFSAAEESQRISDYVQSIEKFEKRHWKHLFEVLKTAMDRTKVVESLDSEARVVNNPLARSRATVFQPSSPRPQDTSDDDSNSDFD